MNHTHEGTSTVCRDQSPRLVARIQTTYNLSDIVDHLGETLFATKFRPIMSRMGWGKAEGGGGEGLTGHSKNIINYVNY